MDGFVDLLRWFGAITLLHKSDELKIHPHTSTVLSLSLNSTGNLEEKAKRNIYRVQYILFMLCNRIVDF